MVLREGYENGPCKCSRQGRRWECGRVKLPQVLLLQLGALTFEPKYELNSDCIVEGLLAGWFLKVGFTAGKSRPGVACKCPGRQTLGARLQVLGVMFTMG